MAYNPKTDVSAGYISPKHQELLQALKLAHKRTKRGELETIIEEAAKKAHINLEFQGGSRG